MPDKSFPVAVDITRPQPGNTFVNVNEVRTYNSSPGMVMLQLRSERILANVELSGPQIDVLIAHLQDCRGGVP